MNNDVKSILIVDDVSENIKLVASILKKENYKIYFALNGSDALEYAETYAINLILLDIMMPEMDGFEVCEKLKSNPETANIPVIFLTAKSDIDSTARGFQVGGVDYLTKPFNSKELLIRVNLHISLQEQKEELVKQKIELEQLNAHKDKFLSIIAHDLRSPFNAIMGFTEVIHMELDAGHIENISDHLKIIDSSAKIAHELLENLLYWARAQTGKLEYNPVIFPINDCISRTINLLTSSALNKSISIDLNTDSVFYTFADQSMIETVMRNLISNAIKFTNDGGQVHAILEKEDNRIAITIADNGEGIPPENIDKLFSINFNITTKGTRGESGTGLGLLLCKEFMELNGGTIQVESEYKKGTSFILHLPLLEN